MARVLWLFLKVALLAVCLGACIPPSIYTTAKTTQPVMLGPVKIMKATKPMPQGPIVDSFQEEINNNVTVVVSQTESASKVTTTTCTLRIKEVPDKYDVAMQQAASKCPQCTLNTQRIEIGAYNLYWLVGLEEKNWANAFFTVNEQAR